MRLGWSLYMHALMITLLLFLPSESNPLSAMLKPTIATYVSAEAIEQQLGALGLDVGAPDPGVEQPKPVLGIAGVCAHGLLQLGEAALGNGLFVCVGGGIQETTSDQEG
jgi:hypothetical protein